MKNKFVHVMTTVLLGSGLLFADAVGYLPASKAFEQQGNGVTRDSVLPAAMGTQQVRNTGLSIRGELPGTVRNDQQGRAPSNSMLLPGTDTNANLLLSKQVF